VTAAAEGLGSAAERPDDVAAAQAAEVARATAAAAERVRAAAQDAAAQPTDPPRAAPTRKVPAAGYAAPSARADDEDGSPVADLLSTTVLAATELAHIGLDVGRAALRSMIDRLPKP